MIFSVIPLVLKEYPWQMTKSDWYVYLVRCADDTLYAGITNNLSRCIKQHNGELRGGARYTASRRPAKLVWSENVDNRSSAQKLEIEIRRLSRAQKLQLVLENKDKKQNKVCFRNDVNGCN